ncbi:ribonuclease E inhibitor RraA/Dimethylmenaquinone methyltransferase [Aspergillus multicolor]|uniref:RraA family protein n=1 Tax=Aspergillus multicolor TaxID=41759 RepID=UPI003CCE2670
MSKAYTSNAFQALKQFSSCDIGDALVKLRYPYGGFFDGLRMRSPAPSSPSSSGASSGVRIHGPAVTVKMIETNSPGPTPPLHFADANRKDAIMYIQQPKVLYSACWGGLMSTRAKATGALGVIVDGRIRDVTEHREMGFPVFSRDTSVLGSAGFTRASEIDVPLQFQGDLWINPGDVLVGDEDGVVVVPPSLVEQVVELCKERAEIDERMFEALKRGGADGAYDEEVAEVRYGLTLRVP